MKTKLFILLTAFSAFSIFSFERNYRDTNTGNHSGNGMILFQGTSGEAPAGDEDEDTKNKKDTPPATSPTETKKEGEGEKDRNYLQYSEMKNFILRQEARNNSNGDAQIIKILRNHKVPEIRAEAASALGRLKRGSKYLHRAIDSDGYVVRQAAYTAIANIASKKSIDYFMKGTKSKYADIRAASFKGLGRSRASLGRELILMEGIKSEDINILVASLEGLGYYNNPEDRVIFKKYLESEQTQVAVAALIGLSLHKSKESLDMIFKALDSQEKLGPYIRYICYAVATNNSSFAATLVLVKLHQAAKDPDSKVYIEKIIAYRKGSGKFAIVSSNFASMRRQPNARGEKILTLNKGDVVRVKKINPKRYKARIANQIVEDNYYFVQMPFENSFTKKSIIEGWVFGSKISVIAFSKVLVKSSNKETDDDEDESDTTSSNESKTSVENKDTTKKSKDDDDDD